MSSIVLSAAVRQNLLALQNTASLMATTQNNLSTGNKVNSALDNPTNYFTASALNNRSSDISNLLDGISNGVQVIQAANTGLTSLQSLISQAKSIANQALQTAIGYSTKSNTTLSSSGGTASNLVDGTTIKAGDTVSIAATGNGTAQTITFGDGTGGTVQSLDQLNAQLAKNNLQATISTTGAITITTTNDVASSTIGAIAFGASNAGTAVKGTAPGINGPVADATSQATRANLVSQYNGLLTQIDQTAADASFNGVNLLNGDQLVLNFNETGKSKLSITGVNDTSAGLGLTQLQSGTDFIDNAATNKVLTTLNTVSSTLRSQASAFGSNLSVVQTRQDFNKSLINVLQTGAANLTQADINLEAANSQALSTRQSLSVSALSLANQSQQSVLQLLR